jgi:hypothetical protein
MKTTPELEAAIVRLHYAEHWKVGTIAAQLDVHPDVVRRVLGLSTAHRRHEALGESDCRKKSAMEPGERHGFDSRMKGPPGADPNPGRNLCAPAR